MVGPNTLGGGGGGTTTTASSCQPVSSSTMSNSSSNSNSSGGGGGSSNNKGMNNNVTHRCVWCRDNKKQLNYVLPTQEGKKECCSEMCLLEFRRAYNKGACSPCCNCECVIRPPGGAQAGQDLKLQFEGKQREFCSSECIDEFREKHGIMAPPVAAPQPPPPPAAAPQQAPPPPAAAVVTTASAPNKHPGQQTGKQKKQDNSAFNKDFKWPEYLQATGGKSAPAHCFKQHSVPPSNEFATDMKLEAIDPRNTTSTCIASVIGYVGPRVRLRLDGSDNANDFWRMVDSREIQPIGTCEKNQGMLQPPLGFRMNASFWPMFLLKTLNGAQMAPDHCFKPEPITPRFNLFKVGYKLEAVDRKNPHLICVATIGSVDRDNVHITFDGWRGAFDYWCKYDSRDIFPVGWCEQANHPLQPPGNKLPLSTTGVSSQSPSPLPQISSSSTTPRDHHHHHHHHHHADGQPTDSTSALPPYTVTLHLHPTCVCGQYLDQMKLKSSPTIIGPSNIQEVYNQFVQILRQSAKSKQEVEKLILLHGSDIKEQGDFWGEILGFIQRFQFCENFVSDKAIDEEDEGGGGAGGGNSGAGGSGSSGSSGSGSGHRLRGSGKAKECSKCGNGGSNNKNGDGDAASKSATGKRKSSAAAKSPATPIKREAEVKEEVGEDDNSRRRSVDHQQPPSKKSCVVVGNSSSSSAANHTHQQQQQSTTTATINPRVLGDPGEWTVDQVISHITSIDRSMNMYAELFKKHEIDGKAMLLLNSDMMMRYMGLKLGPALKICNIISKFKTKNNLKNGGSNGV